MSEAICDEAAENAVLGAIYIRNEAYDDIADVLDVDDFGRLHNRQLFAAMQLLHSSGRAIDQVTIRAELERAGALDVPMAMLLNHLGDGVPRSTNVVHYAALVREKALLRRLRDAARRVLAEVETAGAKGVDLLERTEAAVYGLSSQAVKNEWISSLEQVGELAPLLERMFEEKQAVTGIRSGFVDLDFMTRGFQRGDLVLLGARPSQGKTAFGIQVAHKAAETVNVAFFSVEMSREGIGLRRVIQLADVDGYRMLGGRSSEVEQRRIGEGLARMGELPLYTDESAYLSPLHVRSKLRKLRAKYGAFGLVVIDYLQLMAALPDDRRENKTNQVAGISRMLKLLAREFGVPFLVLSQLNRGPKDGSRPSMSDLRDSGALEQDADVVLLLHRPEVYEQTPQNAGLAEVIISKQRNGPTGIVELTWRGEPMRFENRSTR